MTERQATNSPRPPGKTGTHYATLTVIGKPRPLKTDGLCVRIAGVAPHLCSAMDSAPDFYSGGWGFESLQGCQLTVR